MSYRLVFKEEIWSVPRNAEFAKKFPVRLSERETV